MTTAIEAGARAIAAADNRLKPNSNDYGGAKACIEAAIASGALVPASADRTTLHYVISDIREKSGLGAKPMLSELADAIATSKASAVAEMRERCARLVEETNPVTDEPFWHGQNLAAAIRQLDLSPACGEYVVGWEAMDSAPKDGTEILAFARGDRNYYGVAQWASANPGLGSVEGWFWPFAIRPTHWKPLDAPLAMLHAATRTGEEKQNG